MFRSSRPLVVLAMLLCCLAFVATASASTFTVDTTADGSDANPGDGVCEVTVGAGDCTLRAALEEVDAGCGCETISVDPGVYRVSSDLPTALNNDVVVHGAGADRTIIDGDGTAALFSTFGVALTISDLTLQHALSVHPGAAAFTTGPTGVDLTLTDTVVRDNGAPGVFGGGVSAVPYGAVVATRATISGNHADQGGGISAHTVSLTDSTVTANRADGTSVTGEGGGVSADGGGTAITAVGSLIAGNSGEVGGGLYASNGDVSAVDSTLTGNRVSGYPAFGAAIWSSVATLDGVTVSANGGASTLDARALDLTNTLIGPASSGLSCAPYMTLNETGTNLDAGHSCGLGASSLSDVDPLLQALAGHGGPTQTLALTAGSPAIGAATSACLPFDQRGLPRLSPAGPCDIGAFEGSIAAEPAPSGGSATTPAPPPIQTDQPSTAAPEPAAPPVVAAPGRPLVAGVGRIAEDGSVAVTIDAPGAGPVAVTFRKGVAGSGARAAKATTITLGRGSATAKAAGPIAVKVHPNAAGRRALKAHRSLYVLVTATQGKQASSRTVLLRRKP